MAQKNQLHGFRQETPPHSMDTMVKFIQKTVFVLAILAIAAASLHFVNRQPSNSLSRAELDNLILSIAASEGISPALLKAVAWKESRLRTNCRGKKGEIGLMQVRMTGAVAEWARHHNRELPDEQAVFEPSLNLRIGAWYLAWTGRLWQGREQREVLQLAAYNAGCGTVEKLWLPKNPASPVTLQDITYPQTRTYIQKILAKKKEYEREGFGLTAPQSNAASGGETAHEKQHFQ